MITLIRSRIALIPMLAALMLALFISPTPSVHADGGPDGLLPIYTSPIDITGERIQLHAVAPDRETGKPVDVTLPAGLLGPKFNQLLNTPLSSQIDQYWNVNRDPATGKTPREQACEGDQGIKAQVAKQVSKIDADYSAYDISCDLASTGQLVVKQVGSTLFLGYLLTKNTVSFTATTPYTCNANNGTFLCPNDPRFTVRFATEIVTVMRTSGICQLTAENGTVYVVAASIDGLNGSAEVGKLFAGQKFVAAEVAITNTVKQQKLPLDAAFQELRDSAACKGKSPTTSRILGAFREFETEITGQAIIFRVSHAGIATPSVDAPNPGAVTVLQAPSTPSFTRPTIETSQPMLSAGNTVQLDGQYFPANLNLATALPVTMGHGGYGENSIILGGVCFNGATELEWRAVGSQPRVQRFPGAADGACAASYDATNLTPATAYQFRVRDCDPITCSPWSALLKVTTARAGSDKGKVVLTLDNGVALGTATVNTLGKFASTITIPAGTSGGAHTIHAVNGDA